LPGSPPFRDPRAPRPSHLTSSSNSSNSWRSWGVAELHGQAATVLVDTEFACVPDPPAAGTAFATKGLASPRSSFRSSRNGSTESNSSVVAATATGALAPTAAAAAWSVAVSREEHTLLSRAWARAGRLVAVRVGIRRACV
jgi:hypothetical protein